MNNIILIALDTLRADHLSCYGYGHKTSPVLDRFAGEGVLFENFYAPTIPTQPSYTTVFTGLYSISHGIVSHGGKKPLSENILWLPEILNQAGYTTCAVDNLGRMKPWFHRGYKFYIDPSIRYSSMQLVTAEEINNRAIPWLKEHAHENFFMFVHYWDTHTPYLPQEKYRELFYKNRAPFDPENTSMVDFWKTIHGTSWCQEGGWIYELGEGKKITDTDYIASMYDSEIRYLDDHLAHFLNALDKLNISEETLVIVFSDHGEILDDHPGFFDHHGLYEANIHVPLIMHWPEELKSGMKIPHLVQHIDLAPTILEAAGLKAPEKMEGRSLWPLIEGKETQYYDKLITQECTYQAKWAIRTARYKLIVSREEKDVHGLPPLELYDLKKDPGEENNLYEQKPDTVNFLKEELESWISQMMEKNGLKQDPLVEQGAPLGENWKAWVEKHGYW